MGHTDPCSIPPDLQAACWDPVDAVSGHCQLMSQSDASQELQGLAGTTWVENPSDLLFYDSLSGGSRHSDGQGEATAHPTPHRGARLDTLSRCRQDTGEAAPRSREAGILLGNTRRCWVDQGVAKWRGRERDIFLP